MKNLGKGLNVIKVLAALMHFDSDCQSYLGENQRVFKSKKTFKADVDEEQPIWLWTLSFFFIYLEDFS